VVGGSLSAFLVGFLVVFIPAMIFMFLTFKQTDSEDLSLVGSEVIDLNSRANLPFVCGECGVGVAKEEYVCPQCLSRNKVPR
tara:strand:- start:135 stop:380 length:246 start_codon:yes stop_codon:yes gene_type:complete